MESNVHLFTRSGKWMGVDPSTRTFFEFTQEEWEILKEGMNQSASTKYQELMDSIQETLKPMSTFETQSTQGVYELVLMISQDCNMKCSYCYADAGTYSEEASFMDREIAKTGVEKICQVEDIEEIMFFGGEPFLNFPLIREIVELNKEKGRKLKYGVVTNGTIMTDDMLKVLKENNFGVTVSLDGPPHIHNLCRVYKNGNGTHDKVLRTIEKLKKAGIPCGLEATYNNRVSNQTTPRDVLAYLTQIARHIKIDCVLDAECIDPATLMTPEETYTAYKEWTDCAFEMWEKGELLDVRPISSMVWHLMSSRKLKSETVCKAGGGRVTLFSNGDLYPCFAAFFPKYLIGNVTDDNFVEEYPEKIKEMNRMLSRSQVDHYWFSDLISSVCVRNLEDCGVSHLNFILPNLIEDIIYHLIKIEDTKKFQDTLRRSACGET